MRGKKLKVVITDCAHGSIEEEKEAFAKMDTELILAQVQEEEELVRVSNDADGLLNQYARLIRRVLENLPNCKVISRYGSEESIRELKKKTAKNISDVLAGKWPDSVVNPEVKGKTRALFFRLATPSSTPWAPDRMGCEDHFFSFGVTSSA